MVKSSLHPTILFHFTKKKSTLFSILSETFRLSYARETILGQIKTNSLAVPMVSFCDIKLREIKDHISKYGCYGIGLTKEWANRNGLNPVIYTNKNSHFIDRITKATEGLHNFMETTDNGSYYLQIGANYDAIMNTFRYMKNYEAPLYRKGKLVNENYRYADEREWRYVPKWEEIEYPILPAENIDTTYKKERMNNLISNYRLAFEPDDVRYLIVKNDSEIASLLAHLKKAKSRFAPLTQAMIASRIITVEQIKHDI